VTATWAVQGDEVDITLLMPATRGPFPLVVYLPGLGESSAAGSAWRRVWAEAGYAVLSAQTRTNGAAAWSGERARSFDFRAVALEHFSARALPARLATIHAVIEEAIRRQRQGGDSIDSRIDTTRIAIAGYDLGAMSAMAVAGQTIADQPAPPLPSAIRSVIALSPYADFAGMGTEARFRDIRLPVLSVTSPEDTDAYGLVTTAAVRRAPYQYMPPGRKYLLLLGAGPHSLLGGQEHPTVERDENRAARRTDTRQDDRGTRGAGDGRSGRTRGDSATAGASMPVISRPDINVSWATQLRNVQGVTTAYLDATVKDDGRAADWLARDAQRWLGGSASLQAK
jgi:dienelactone hydrolase